MSDSVRNAMYYGLNPCFDDLYRKSRDGYNFVHLIDLIGSKENIMLAYRNIKSNKGSNTPGVDGQTIDDLRTMSVSQIVTMVRNKLRWYVPKPIRRVEIPKSSDPTKTRPLGIPCIVDRLVQACIKQILEPIAEAKFYEHSLGFRANRCCENAIAVAEHMINIGKLYYVVDVDIKGFFDNIDHGCLMRQLWKMGIHDRKLLAIIHAMLKAPIILNDYTKIYPERGTPQGSILSPLLSLIVLNDLDWWIANQWAEHPFIKDMKYDKWVTLRKQRIREVHIVRYADDFKLICRTKEDAEALLDETSEWLLKNLKLETSPEKSGVTNLKKKYTDFLGFEIKVLDRSNNIGPNASTKVRRWTTTSRVKPKALIRLNKKLHEEADKLVTATESTAKAVVGKYNSVVDGLQNYYSLASQIGSDFGSIQRGLKLHMYHKIKELKAEAPKEIKLSTKDVKFSKSKQTRYLYGQMVHPIGYVKNRIPLMPKKEICNYTEAGRALQNIKIGAPEVILSWLARHTPPSLSIEEADNRISAFSAQKGKCSILGVPLEMGGVVVLHKNPRLGRGVGRYRNLTLVCVLAGSIINEPDPSVARSMLAGLKIDQKAIKTINKLRKYRNFNIL
ncbi:MAG: group II intron reverse transcriptase/maturase [Clostridia bacterium]|nr:group II intron reverse transcriptase/maturase [Clostridia bacterium]